MAQLRCGVTSHHPQIAWVAPVLLALLGCGPAEPTSNPDGADSAQGGSASVGSGTGGTKANRSEEASGGSNTSPSSEQSRGGTSSATHRASSTASRASGGASNADTRTTGSSGGGSAQESTASGGRKSSKSTLDGGTSAKSGSGGNSSSTNSAGRGGVGGSPAAGGTKSNSGGDSSTSTSGTCPYTGHVSYTLAKESQPTAQQQAAYDKITAAMDTAVRYYNCYTDITKVLNISYVPSVATADGNINGSIRFGSNASMNKVTAMHEISHTVGIGTASKWSSLLSNGQFTGTNAKAEVAKLPVLDAADGVVHADSQHFWPGGLNYESEGQSEADLIAHCQMVVAIRKDLGL